MKQLLALLLAPILLGLAAWATPDPAVPTPDEVEFEKLANGFALDNNLVGIDEWDIDFREILNKGYAHVALGIYDVYYPVPGLKDDKNAAMFKELCLHLLMVQKQWMERMEPSVGKLREPLDDLETVEKWIEKWKTSSLTKLDKEDSLNLAESIKATDKQKEALVNLQASMVRGDSLGLNREEAESSPVILMPSRYEFVRLVCYAGLVFEDSRDAYWADDLHTWIEGTIMDMRAIALEYVDPDDPTDLKKGRPMNDKHKDELQQHVVQRAFLSLLRNYYGDRIDPALAVGLAINVDIDVFGKDHARLEGDPEGNSTPAREVFVPGGNPNGGTLPALSAESPWRETEGEFRYLKKLAQSQDNGNSSSEDSKAKLRSFALSSATAGAYVVHAPFLGSWAYDKAMPPQDFVGDYLEFFRAYRTGFAEFLRSGAGGSERQSEKDFAKLMIEMATANASEDDERTFEEIILAVYEVPLSSAEPGKDDLEGRFLKWLKTKA